MVHICVGPNSVNELCLDDAHMSSYDCIQGKVRQDLIILRGAPGTMSAIAGAPSACAYAELPQSTTEQIKLAAAWPLAVLGT